MAKIFKALIKFDGKTKQIIEMIQHAEKIIRFARKNIFDDQITIKEAQDRTIGNLRGLKETIIDFVEDVKK